MNMILLSLILAFVSPPAVAPNIVWIDLRPTAEVEGFRVTLADVATIDALDATTRSRVERVELGRFDQGREQLVFDRDTIERLVKSQGVHEVVFGGAPRTVVRPRLVQIGLDRIRTAVERHVRGVLGENAGIETVELGPNVRPFDVPKARYRLELRVDADPKNAAYAGLLNLPVTVEVDGEPLLRQIVAVEVARRVRVIVARKRVNRGRPVEADDVEIEEREVTRLGAAPYRSPDEVIGMIARNGLVAGQIVLARDLQATPVIQKGDLVSAELVLGGLHARVLCRARKQGAPGERIELENVESNRTIYATVVDSRTVRVVLP